MKCPLDDTVLQMTERQGIEIDYCPQCRGVWLDRGELDKLIDRTADVAGPAPSPPAPQPGPPSYGAPRPQPFDDRRAPAYDDRRGHDRGRDSHDGRKRRKESFLGELFDF